MTNHIRPWPFSPLRMVECPDHNENRTRKLPKPGAFMNFSAIKIILGSRSAQRLALLEQIVPAERITVCPPRTVEEAGFEGLANWAEIETRLLQIAREKCADVVGQVLHQQTEKSAGKTFVLTADTVIVAGEADRLLVLGQPPEPHWRDAVRGWFENHHLGKTHRAASAVCLADLAGNQCERVAVSEVTFSAAAAGLLEWYLDTGEPRGKAGGYGIQGAGSVFVSEVKGSLSNVIGLPLRDVLEMFEELRLPKR